MTDNLHSGGDVARHVQTQLTGPGDIKAAHQFFQPTGGEAHLPAISGFTGGSETTALHAAMKVGESTAMAAAQHAGAQVVSPLIQLIMRMPGHLGLMTSFFEALSHFFAPAQDMLSSVFDHSMLAAHAEGALNSASAMGDHMSLDLSLLPDDAPVFNMDAGGPDLSDSFTADMHGGDQLFFNSSESSDLVFADPKNVGGILDFSNPQFEQSASSISGAGTGLPSDQQYLAWDNTTPTFRPQMGGGGMQIPATQPTQMQMPAATSQQPIMIENGVPTQQATLDGPQQIQQAPDAGAGAGAERGQLMDNTPQAQAQGDGQTADASQAGNDAPAEASETTPYTVQHGDNLWDIARHHLGDGSRWTEIYQMNQDVIGGNPRLIMPGAELKLPGTDIASGGDYVVQPGDNLWDISRHHLGGGEHWPELYHGNEAVVGSNPDLIHPGQHLNLGEHGASEQIASADPAGAHHAAPAAHHTAHASAHHSTSHVAHNTTHGGNSSSEHAAPDKIAQATHPKQLAHAAQAHTQGQMQQVEGSQQVPQALAHSPQGETLGLKAQQLTLDQSSVQGYEQTPVPTVVGEQH